MKQLILALGAVGLLSTTTLAQEKTEAELKVELLNKANTAIVEQLKTMGLEEVKVKKYADCYIADLDQHLSYTEIKEFNDLSEDSEPSEELKGKLMNIGQECAKILE